MKDIIYPINAFGSERFKIGITEEKNLNERIKSLQTGCPDELLLINKFKTKYATVIEKNLHRVFMNKKTHGEWFLMSNVDIILFK